MASRTCTMSYDQEFDGIPEGSSEELTSNCSEGGTDEYIVIQKEIHDDQRVFEAMKCCQKGAVKGPVRTVDTPENLTDVHHATKEQRSYLPSSLAPSVLKTNLKTAADASIAGSDLDQCVSDLLCPLCTHLITLAVEIRPCGHSFCASCLSHHFGAQLQAGILLTCPFSNCRRPERIVADPGTRYLVNKMRRVRRSRNGSSSSCSMNGGSSCSRTGGSSSSGGGLSSMDTLPHVPECVLSAGDHVHAVGYEAASLNYEASMHIDGKYVQQLPQQEQLQHCASDSGCTANAQVPQLSSNSAHNHPQRHQLDHSAQNHQHHPPASVSSFWHYEEASTSLRQHQEHPSPDRPPLLRNRSRLQQPAAHTTQCLINPNSQVIGPWFPEDVLGLDGMPFGWGNYEAVSPARPHPEIPVGKGARVVTIEDHVPVDPNLALFDVVTRMVADALHEEELELKTKQRRGGSCKSLTEASGQGINSGDSSEDTRRCSKDNGCDSELHGNPTIHAASTLSENPTIHAASTLSENPTILAASTLSENPTRTPALGSLTCLGDTALHTIDGISSESEAVAEAAAMESLVAEAANRHYGQVHTSLRSVESPNTPQLPVAPAQAVGDSRCLPVWEVLETPAAATSTLGVQLGVPPPHGGVRRAPRRSVDLSLLGSPATLAAAATRLAAAAAAAVMASPRMLCQGAAAAALGRSLLLLEDNAASQSVATPPPAAPSPVSSAFPTTSVEDVLRTPDAALTFSVRSRSTRPRLLSFLSPSASTSAEELETSMSRNASASAPDRLEHAPADLHKDAGGRPAVRFASRRQHARASSLHTTRVWEWEAGGSAEAVLPDECHHSCMPQCHLAAALAGTDDEEEVLDAQDDGLFRRGAVQRVLRTGSSDGVLSSEGEERVQRAVEEVAIHSHYVDADEIGALPQSYIQAPTHNQSATITTSLFARDMPSTSRSAECHEFCDVAECQHHSATSTIDVSEAICPHSREDSSDDLLWGRDCLTRACPADQAVPERVAQAGGQGHHRTMQHAVSHHRIQSLSPAEGVSVTVSRQTLPVPTGMWHEASTSNSCYSADLSQDSTTRCQDSTTNVRQHVSRVVWPRTSSSRRSHARSRSETCHLSHINTSCTSACSRDAQTVTNPHARSLSAFSGSAAFQPMQNLGHAAMHPMHPMQAAGATKTLMSLLCPLCDDDLPVEIAAIKHNQIHGALLLLKEQAAAAAAAGAVQTELAAATAACRAAICPISCALSLESLARLMWSDDEARDMVASTGGIRTILDIMRLSRGLSSIQTSACLAIMGLVRGDGELCQATQWAVAKAGGVELISEAMESFPSSLMMQLAALLTLVPLTLDNCMMQAYLSRRTVPAVLHALCTFQEHPAIQCKGLVLLGVMLEGADPLQEAVRQRMVELGVVSRVASALEQMGGHSDDVLWACLFCLAGLARHAPGRRVRNQDGHCQHLSKALSTASEDALAQALSVGLLQRLRSYWEAYHDRVRVRGGEPDEMISGAGRFLFDRLEAAEDRRRTGLFVRRAVCIAALAASAAATVGAVCWLSGSVCSNSTGQEASRGRSTGVLNVLDDGFRARGIPYYQTS